MRRTKAFTDIVVLTISALFVRLSWVFLRPWVAGDSVAYLTLARNIRFHHLFSVTESAIGPFLPSAQRPPLYPALIALLWIKDSPPTELVLVLQAMMGAATVALLYLSARDRFNRKVAGLAAAFMVIAPMSVHFTAVILTETFFTFLLVLAIFLWGRGRAVLAGLVFGLAALTRPTVLPFLIILPMISLLPRFRDTARRHLVIVLVAVIVLSVWVVRNAIVFRRFIPVAASGWGTSLLLGTIDTEFVGLKIWTGSGWAVADVNKHPLLHVEPGLSETETDRVLLQRAVGRIKERPLHWVVVRMEQYPKLFFDTGDYVLGTHNAPIREPATQRLFGVLLVKFLFVAVNLAALALAVLGIYSVRLRSVDLLHLIAFPLFLLAVQIPMWTEARYAIPIMPVMAIFSAVGLQQLWNNRSLVRPGSLI